MSSLTIRVVALWMLLGMGACDSAAPVPASLVATQTQPLEVLPGQGFDVLVRLTNTSSVPVDDVRVGEAFQGTQPPSAEERVGALAVGEERTVTFHLAAPVAAPRGESESLASYHQRLEDLERQPLVSRGEVHFAETPGVQAKPLSLSSDGRVVLPRLSLRLEGPVVALPGEAITYTVTVTNGGLAGTASGSLQVVLSDATRVEVALDAMAPGATWNKAVTWTPPPLPVRQRGETVSAYAARLRALEGQAQRTQVALSWRDGQGNAYGSLVQESVAALHVDVPPFDLPPAPEERAPALSPFAVTPFVDAVSFLYSGEDPIQVGVAPGTLVPHRLAVLRGKVRSRQGYPLEEVRVSVLDHPEYGHTLTREDGLFDLAVNGGGLLTVRYEAEGLLPSQRQLHVPWGDFAWLPDVVLVPLDPQGTPVDFSGTSTTHQVARGSPVTDADGTRQATLLFAPGTQALAVLANGDEVPLYSATVRATEYTVGEEGPASMPAHLPPTSGYTYAVELSLDEALALDSQEVRFTQPVASYVDNFLGFPVGGTVPSGYYDRRRGVWLPSTNGRILQVHGVLEGVAQLDVTGDGVPDSAAVLATLGISEAEQRQLASLYPVGKSLWRVPVSHFTPWDYNWPYGPPPGARPPTNAPPQAGPENKPDCQKGSVIDCQNQALGESLPLTGTSSRLHYRSDRVRGQDKNTLRIPVSGASVPPSLEGIVVEVNVAGRAFTYELPAAPHQTLSFTWDGKDAYGRKVQGEAVVTGRTGYRYPLVYLKPAEFPDSFAQLGSEPVTSNRERREMTSWQSWRSRVGGWSESPEDLGGWRLSVHHQWDPHGGRILFGHGETSSGSLTAGNIFTVAGTGVLAYSLDSLSATQTHVGQPVGVAVGPDGAFYLVELYSHRVRRVSPDGSIKTVAGIVGLPGLNGNEGELGNSMYLDSPSAVAVGPDGSLYIADRKNQRIRRVRPNGTMITVAGSGIPGHGTFGGDGGPATQAYFSSPESVAVAPDGSLYIADVFNQRIRRVDPKGRISTVAGTGTSGFGGDGGPAALARFNYPRGVAVGPDGSVYIADTGNQRIRRVGPEGTVTTVAGSGTPGTGGFDGDGGPATLARFLYPQDVAVGPDGSLYIADDFNQRIRRVDPEGLITTVAGSGTPGTGGFGGDGGPATLARFNGTSRIAVGPDGTLYIADRNNHRVRAVRPAPLSASSVGGISILSEAGGEVYVFGSGGRHLRTVNALTGALHYQFDYSTDGRLTSVTDGDGLVTRIERDTSGKPLAIIAPHGQRTRLTWDVQGYLSSLTNPAGERVELEHSTHGLLTSMRDARGGLHQYTYDARGRLARDTQPTGGYKHLSRTDAEDGYSVAVSTALGTTTRYQVRELAGGGQQRTTTAPDGTVTSSLRTADGSTTTTLAPDGTRTTEVLGPDARFGMQVPLRSSVQVTLPGGLTSSSTHGNVATYVQGDVTKGLETVVDTRSQNGRTQTATYAVASRTLRTRSPSGRLATSVLDARGRLVRQEVVGVLPLEYSYDAEGRPWKVTQGERTETYTYDAAGYLATVEDVLGRTTDFSYNGAGRLTAERLPGGRTVGLASDAHGNLTRMVPPGRSAHDFRYTPADTVDSDTPPPLSSAPLSPTRYAYNGDGALTSISLPDGASVQLARDGAGRVDALTTPRTTVDFVYDAQGHLAALTDSAGPSLAYAYDGPLVKSVAWSGEVQGGVSYTYTPDFSLQALEVQGQSFAYAYDLDGLLISAGALSLGRGQDTGLLSTTTLDQVRTEQQYNAHGEVRALSAVWGSTPLYSLILDRDVAGRITSKTEATSGVTRVWGYAYDLAGRLHAVTLDGAPYSAYGYDLNGNRTSLTQGGATLTATYDAQERLQTQGAATYAFGLNGDLQQRSRSSEAAPTQYVYDALGALTHVQLPDGTQVDYVLDASSRRVGKRLGGTLVQGFLYDGPVRVVAELDGAGAVVSRFVYASQRHVPDYMLKDGVTYRLLTDQLGSIRLVVNASTGVVEQSLEYGPFGEVLSDSNPGFQPFGFAGGLYDSHSGLTRFGVRDYDAEAGRWTARDPLRFAGGQLNLYQYAMGDPVNRVDPTGFISIGFSGYDGVGGGFELAWVPGQGFSACGQVGFGAGLGFEFKPFGGLADPGVSVKAEITNAALGSKMKVSAEVSLGPCGPSFKGEGGVGFGPAFVSFFDGQVSIEPIDLGAKSEASINAKACVRF
ncbi:RHS repeat-associated core domain-containing protein [Archangium primigenium]|uniref:NHL domain-containing protein n=1 Tax=[Archangium] primigenium TaxID=2792470 RepID=UPI0019571C5B|nr:RHS repeat-associated core domain-containing protein [Archangium primigenium]MBM7117715.1 hypothetical protein [Archangium primigenium]